MDPPLPPAPPAPPPPPQKPKRNTMYAIGFELAASVAGMIVLGWLIDSWFGSKPWGVVGGAILGLVGGFLNFLRTATSEMRRANKEFQRDYSGGEIKGKP